MTLVSVMDREGDCFELFVERRRLGNVELLVRAKHNRSLGKGVAKLFDAVRRQSEQGRLEVFVGHRSARRSSRSQKAVSKQDARVAQVSLRWREVQLPVPVRSELKDESPMPLSLVHVQEIDAPAGQVNRMVSADDAAGELASRGRAGGRALPSALANRTLAQDSQAPKRRPDRACGDDQRGHRLAASGDDIAGTRNTGAAHGSDVHGRGDWRIAGFCEG